MRSRREIHGSLACPAPGKRQYRKAAKGRGGQVAAHAGAAGRQIEVPGPGTGVGGWGAGHRRGCGLTGSADNKDHQRNDGGANPRPVVLRFLQGQGGMHGRDA